MRQTRLTTSYPLRGERFLARVYILGLSLIAILAVVTHSVFDILLAAGQTSAYVIDVAGEQRTRVQRIALLSLRLAHAEDEGTRLSLRRSLAVSAARLHSAHVALVKGDPKQGLPGLSSSAVDAIYFDMPHRLDLQVRTFTGAAMELADRPAGLIRPQSLILNYLAGPPEQRLMESLKAVEEQYVAETQATTRNLRLVLWGLLAALLLTIALEGVFLFRPVFRRLLLRTQELYDMTRADPLTGCRNRRGFMDAADMEHERVRRYGQVGSVLLLDIDHFKVINDTYGHPAGDKVIRALVSCCSRLLRRSDTLGRLGGEEFAVLLPETSVDQAMMAAEKLRASIEAMEIKGAGNVLLRTTVSIGVSGILPEDSGILDTLNRADARLYEAKRSGRNSVVGPKES